MKVKAVKGENIFTRAALKATLPEEPVRTAKVLTTASFADSPVTKAVDARQSERPRGAKTGDINLPKEAKML